MGNRETLNYMNNKDMLKLVAAVAGPIALQGLIGSSLNLVDNLMIGGLGELALNAVGVSVQIFFVYWLFIYGFASGAATFVSQYFGVGDYASIKKTVGFTFVVCFGMGLLFFSVAFFFPQYVLRIFTKYPEVIEQGVIYVKTGAPCFLLVSILQPLVIALRVTQQTVYPLVCSTIALCVNTLMNYSLIYGHFGMPQLGIKGAALATVISRIVEVSLIIVMVFVRKNILKGDIPVYFKFNGSLAGKLFRNSLPTTINETMWALGTSMYVAAFARIGITEGAAIQACNTVNNLLTLAAFSVGDAILILVGQRLGENKMDEALWMTRYLLKLTFIAGAVSGVLLIVISRPILGLFDFTPEGQRMAFLILVIYGAAMSLKAMNCSYVVGVLRCGGDTRYAMFAEVGAVWLVGVPAAFLSSLVFHLPIYLAVLTVQLADVVEIAVLTYRYKKMKWLRNVITENKNVPQTSTGATAQ